MVVFMFTVETVFQVKSASVFSSVMQIDFVIRPRIYLQREANGGVKYHFLCSVQFIIHFLDVHVPDPAQQAVHVLLPVTSRPFKQSVRDVAISGSDIQLNYSQFN